MGRLSNIISVLPMIAAVSPDDTQRLRANQTEQWGWVASELGVKESYQHAPKRVNQGSGEADVGSLPNNITL